MRAQKIGHNAKADGSGRGRTALCSNLTAISVAAFGIMITPIMAPQWSAAVAADECGAIGNGGVADVVTCGKGAVLGSGVTYDGSAQVDELELTLTGTQVTGGGVSVKQTNGSQAQMTVKTVPVSVRAPEVSITNSSGGDAGLEIQTSGADAAVTVEHGAGTITGSGGSREGIRVDTDGVNASILVTTDTGMLVTSTSDVGILLEANGGADVTANVNGDVNGSDGGVEAQAVDTGEVRITTGADSEVTATGTYSFFGTWQNGTGIEAGSEDGLIEVTTGKGSNVTGSLRGINAVSSGTGDVTDTTGDSSKVSGIGTNFIIFPGSGIIATSEDGSATIATGTDAVGAGQLFGIDARTNGDGTVTVLVNEGGSLSSGTNPLLAVGGSSVVNAAANGDGAVDVDVHAHLTAGLVGVKAISDGSSNVDVHGYSDITVDVDGVNERSTGSGNIDVQVAVISPRPLLPGMALLRCPGLAAPAI